MKAIIKVGEGRLLCVEIFGGDDEFFEVVKHLKEDYGSAQVVTSDLIPEYTASEVLSMRRILG